MPPPRPAHEDPLRRTFTREQLDEAVEQARAEVADNLATGFARLESDRIWGGFTTWGSAAMIAARIAREVTP